MSFKKKQESFISANLIIKILILTPIQCWEKFSHNVYFIVITCKAPKNGVGTILVDPEMSAVFGEEYNYTCIHGYTTKDNLTVQCVDDDTWSSLPPKCTGKLI